MRAYDIIFKKRNGEKLSPEELEFIVTGFIRETIPDYQMAAFLMAAFIQGLDDEETANLTRIMLYSGRVIDLAEIRGPKIDKHSTGGVGDGISLVLAPLVASCGVVVPMMSGRGLGHTGGTLDKLESIPGFRVNLSVEEFKKQLSAIGVAMIGQTEDVCPADKKIYALRDVTATVDSISLIAASIMSKKLAEGADGLVLDVKTGNGAFMTGRDSARALARAMVSIGKLSGKKMLAIISDMNQPLGRMVGNALEIGQAIEVLQGNGPGDFQKLVLELGGRMLILGKIVSDLDNAKKILQEKIKKKEALKKFAEMVKWQGGDPEVVVNPQKVLPTAKKEEVIVAREDGWLSGYVTRDIGVAAIYLRAGREKKEDTIDYSAGIRIEKKIGDIVRKGEPLFRLYYNDLAAENLAMARRLIQNSITITSTRPPELPLIYEEIK